MIKNMFTSLNLDQLKYSSNGSTFYFPRTTSQGSLSFKKVIIGMLSEGTIFMTVHLSFLWFYKYLGILLRTRTCK